MSEYDKYDSAGPVTQEFLSTAKKMCTYHSYGEFEGLRVPSLAELYQLKGLLDGAIYELSKKDNDGN